MHGALASSRDSHPRLSCAFDAVQGFPQSSRRILARLQCSLGLPTMHRKLVRQRTAPHPRMMHIRHRMHGEVASCRVCRAVALLQPSRPWSWQSPALATHRHRERSTQKQACLAWPCGSAPAGHESAAPILCARTSASCTPIPLAKSIHRSLCGRPSRRPSSSARFPSTIRRSLPSGRRECTRAQIRRKRRHMVPVLRGHTRAGPRASARPSTMPGRRDVATSRSDPRRPSRA